MKIFHAKIAKNRKECKDLIIYLCGLGGAWRFWFVTVSVLFLAVQAGFGASFNSYTADRSSIDNLVASGELQKVAEHRTVAGTTIRYQQLYHNYTVIGGGVTLRTDDSDKLISIYSSLAELSQHNSPDYSISSDQAVQIAVQSIDSKQLRGNVKVDAVILPQNGLPIACWRIMIPALIPLGDWEIFVNGATGDVMLIEDRLQRVDGVGLVFNPDPMTAIEDSTLTDDDDAEDAIPEEAYSEIELLDIEQDEQRYLLTGPYVDTSPTEDRAAMDEPEFPFNRADDRFEEVMAYYHIDRQARYMIELGFDDLPPTPQQINVNGIADDLSFFSPGTGIITYGSGGVDDGEDADVILHEYSHALLNQILPAWRGGDTGLLTEGICDYLAGEWSLEVNRDFQPFQLYNWDGNNEFWDGRILNSDHHYPDDADRERHDAGQLWSSLLTEIRLATDERDLWNSVVIDHLYMLGDSATVLDAAEALLLSDSELADRQFRHIILRGCEQRGIFARGRFAPQITHTPLPDNDQPNLARPVQARITSDIPINPERVHLVYRAGEQTDTVFFDTTDTNNILYVTYFPAMIYEGEVRYYISAFDESGVGATLPMDAPDSMFNFLVGPDHVLPRIVEFDPLPNSVFPVGEIVVSARVSDNIAVASVKLYWSRQDMQDGGEVDLHRLQGDRYIGRLRWNSAINAIVNYQLHVLDGAGNESLSGVGSFEISRQEVIDDFESANARWAGSAWIRDSSDAYTGDWSLADRNPLTHHAPRSAVLTLDETWDLSFAIQAQLTFFESHRIDGQAGETGRFEVSEDGGDSWQSQLELSGNQPWWAQRQLSLDDFCGRDAAPITVRWRVVTPDSASARSGWKIDDISLTIGNIVAADEANFEAVPRSITLNPYPNPVNGTLTLRYEIPQAGHIELYDLHGRQLMRSPLSAELNRIQIESEPYPAGVYWIRLTAGDSERIRKVVFLK